MHLKIIIFFFALFIGLIVIGNEQIMGKFYDLLGRLFFSRQQEWQRRRSAKITTWVVVFSVVLAFAFVNILKLMNSHNK